MARLVDAGLLVALVWGVLLAGGWALGPWLGREAATCVAFAAALLPLWITRTRRRRGAPGRGAAAARLGLAGLVAGFASYPLFALAIAAAGTALGLAPVAPVAAGAGSPPLWLATLVLAPVFEELLYRERLLPALHAALGSAPALAASSALFALPHLEPWPVLAAFGVGLVLGGLRLAAGSVAPCIGMHAGLNLAALLCGAPPRGCAPTGWA